LHQVTVFVLDTMFAPGYHSCANVSFFYKDTHFTLHNKSGTKVTFLQHITILAPGNQLTLAKSKPLSILHERYIQMWICHIAVFQKHNINNIHQDIAVVYTDSWDISRNTIIGQVCHLSETIHDPNYINISWFANTFPYSFKLPF